MGEATKILPIALLIAGRRCVVVGGGPIATRKVRDLLDAGAHVHIVSPKITDQLHAWVQNDGRVSWRCGTFEPGDLAQARLVITATANRAVDAHVFDEGERLGLFVNSADDPERCNFYLMGLVRRDPVVVAVSTGGTSPALAAYLKRRLDGDLEAELGKLAELLGEVRHEFIGRGVSTESLPWSSVVTDELVDLATRGLWDDVRTSVVSALGVES